MKKIKQIAPVLMGAMLLSTGVYAENLYDTAVDYSKGSIVFSGKTDSISAPITIQAFKGDKTTTDFESNVANAANYAIFVGQAVTDENGEFEFSFDYKGDTTLQDANGVEKIKLNFVYGDTKKADSYSMSYINNATYGSAVGSLNGATTLADFTTAANKYPFLLGLDSELGKSIDTSAAISNLYNSIATTPLDKNDSSSIKKRGYNFVVAQAINEKKLTSISDSIDNMKISDDLKQYIKFFVKDSTTEQKFVSLLNGKTINTEKELENALTEAMILTAVQYPQGYTNLQNVCVKYSTFIGINKNYSNQAYSEVAGSTNITTLSGLVSALDSNNGGGGGGGGGNSSASSDNKGGTTISIPGGVNAENKQQPVNMPFDDIAGVEWAHIAISTLSDKGIVNGKSEDKYCPDDYITREEFVKIIVCAAGVELNATGNRFDDVDENSWYAPYVNAAAENGLCGGMGDGKFGVGINITRQDAAVMIYNSLLKKNVEFTSTEEIRFNDSENISDYATEAVKQLSGKGIVNGDDNQCFNPKSLLTRAEAAQLVYNCIKYY